MIAYITMVTMHLIAQRQGYAHDVVFLAIRKKGLLEFRKKRVLKVGRFRVRLIFITVLQSNGRSD